MCGSYAVVIAERYISKRIIRAEPVHSLCIAVVSPCQSIDRFVTFCLVGLQNEQIVFDATAPSIKGLGRRFGIRGLVRIGHHIFVDREVVILFEQYINKLNSFINSLQEAIEYLVGKRQVASLNRIIESIRSAS